MTTDVQSTCSRVSFSSSETAPYRTSASLPLAEKLASPAARLGAQHCAEDVACTQGIMDHHCTSPTGPRAHPTPPEVQLRVRRCLNAKACPTSSTYSSIGNTLYIHMLTHLRYSCVNDVANISPDDPSSAPPLLPEPVPVPSPDDPPWPLSSDPRSPR